MKAPSYARSFLPRQLKYHLPMLSSTERPKTKLYLSRSGLNIPPRRDFDVDVDVDVVSG